MPDRRRGPHGQPPRRSRPSSPDAEGYRDPRGAPWQGLRLRPPRRPRRSSALRHGPATRREERPHRGCGGMGSLRYAQPIQGARKGGPRREQPRSPSREVRPLRFEIDQRDRSTSRRQSRCRIDRARSPDQGRRAATQQEKHPRPARGADPAGSLPAPEESQGCLPPVPGSSTPRHESLQTPPVLPPPRRPADYWATYRWRQARSMLFSPRAA